MMRSPFPLQRLQTHCTASSLLKARHVHRSSSEFRSCGLVTCACFPRATYVRRRRACRACRAGPRRY
eukprot:5391381-Pleurochrysis_carterae.AAC.1